MDEPINFNDKHDNVAFELVVKLFEFEDFSMEEIQKILSRVKLMYSIHLVAKKEVKNLE